MRTILLTIASSAAVLAAAPAFAQAPEQADANYVQLSLGASVAGRTKVSVSGLGSEHGDLDEGLFAAVAGGRSLSSGLSFEAEGLYLKNDIKTGDIDAVVGAPLDASARTLGLLANAHYSMPAGPVRLAVGAGIGYGETKYKLLGDSASESGVIWQAIAGVEVPVGEKVTWNLKYRYVRGPKAEETAVVGLTSYEVKVRTDAHVVALGAKLNF